MERDFLALLLVAAVTLAGPLLIAALGELISETAGVINIQLEGMMLAGAVSGVAGALLTQNIGLAFLAAIAGGLAVAALHGIA